jgi:cell division protein FtsB
MNRSQEEETSRLGPVVRAAVILLLLLLVTAGVQSWRDLTEARELKSSLEERIAATEESIVILRDRTQRIESDPAILEQLAREELGWVRDSDIVVVLPKTDEAFDETDASSPDPNPQP